MENFFISTTNYLFRFAFLLFSLLEISSGLEGVSSTSYFLILIFVLFLVGFEICQ
jgi:hypothetical protein